MVDHMPKIYITMGLTAGELQRRYAVSREDQDAFSYRSHQNALKAQADGRFDEEIVPLEVETTTLYNGKPATRKTVSKKDEGPRADTSLEALAKLKPVFHASGSVTAGNSSQTSDGAAAAIVTSEKKARTLGLKPMPLGLDLRGGLYLLYQVDVNSAVGQALEGYAQDARRALTAASVPLKDVAVGAGGQASSIRIQLAPGADVNAARAALNQPLQGLAITTAGDSAGPVIEAAMTSAQVRERQDYAIQQNITTLRNRVNELGVSEPIVQRQGVDRINVQLPGVQNSAEVKDILGRVATLEFRLEDMQNNAVEAAQLGRAPLGSSSIPTPASAGRFCSSARSSPRATSSPTRPPGSPRKGPRSTYGSMRAPGRACCAPRARISTSAWRWC
jgi:hypothetical protein